MDEESNLEKIVLTPDELSQFAELGELYSVRKIRREINLLVEMYFSSLKDSLQREEILPKLVEDLVMVSGVMSKEYLTELSENVKKYLPNVLHNYRILSEEIGLEKAIYIAKANLDWPKRGLWYTVLEMPNYTGEIARYILDLTGNPTDPKVLEKVGGLVSGILHKIKVLSPIEMIFSSGKKEWGYIKEIAETLKESYKDGETFHIDDISAMLTKAMKMNDELIDEQRPAYHDLIDKGIKPNEAFKYAKDETAYRNILLANESFNKQ